MVEFEVPMEDVRQELGPQADAFLLQLEKWSISTTCHMRLEKGAPLYFMRIKYNEIKSDIQGDTVVNLRLLRNAVTLASILRAKKHKESHHPQGDLI
ncbi:hypothetical protein [Deinococcus hopiensis]|uniref:hypothetical protein n=1 Tax=Deinococcus hopiensis TaxID=309885 RepID=UPI00111C5D16|nr:hypothetical protein [Deinococcus hopiensis]